MKIFKNTLNLCKVDESLYTPPRFGSVSWSSFNEDQIQVSTNVQLLAAKLPEELKEVDISEIDVDDSRILFNGSTLTAYYKFIVPVTPEEVETVKQNIVSGEIGWDLYQLLLQTKGIEWIKEQRTADLENNEELSQVALRYLERGHIE